MTLRVRLTEEADRHLTAAAKWYERQRPGLGIEFLDQALTALPRLVEHPLRYPIVRRDIRRAPMARFPYGIYFRVEQSKIVIVAIMHAGRRPRRWQLD
jgi:plasmid stabilization system protein ParE